MKWQWLRKTLWDSAQLNKYGRLGLISVVTVALISNALISFTGASEAPRTLAETGLLLAIGCFALRPPIAAIALVLAGVAAIGTDTAGAYVLAVAAVAGLVVFTCSTLLSIGYLVAVSAWAVIAEFATDSLNEGASIGMIAIGLASAGVGWALRSSRHRERALAADVDRLTQETARAIQGERDRIADELHNIIAHDITIVVMHARTLELLDDQEERSRSTEVITTAATQALTDIRRMLRIAHGMSSASPDVDAADEPIAETLRAIHRELSDLCGDLDLEVPARVRVSTAINATLRHVARECATNIMKHAPHSPRVRIRLLQEADTVSLTIANAPGRPGTAQSGSATGYGLDRMAHRVELLGGTFTAGMNGGDWVVSATVPSS